MLFVTSKTWGKHGGSTWEAWGKLGEARSFWGKHAFCPFKNLEKTGEAIEPSTLFIILKCGIWEWGDEGCAPYVAYGVSSRILPAAGRRLVWLGTTP